MNVLHRVHRWLRPGGKLVDIHPEPEDARVEVLHADGRTYVGPFQRPVIYEKVNSARDALNTMEAGGWFARERAVRFELLYHFKSVDAWLAFRLERGATTQVDPALLARASQTLADEPGELLLREQMRATRYRQQSAS